MFRICYTVVVTMLKYQINAESGQKVYSETRIKNQSHKCRQREINQEKQGQALEDGNNLLILCFKEHVLYEKKKLDKYKNMFMYKIQFEDIISMDDRQNNPTQISSNCN